MGVLNMDFKCWHASCIIYWCKKINQASMGIERLLTTGGLYRLVRLACGEVYAFQTNDLKALLKELESKFII